MGLSSPNYILLITKGERNISLELAEKLSDVMKHNAFEKEYFLALIRLESATNPKEKLDAQKTMLRLARKISTTVMSACQIDVVASWQHLLIRECVFFKDFRPSAEYVVEKTDGLITLTEAEDAIGTLIKGGYWVRNPQGQWESRDPVLDTGDDVFKEAAMNKLHAETLSKWSRWMDELDPEQKELGLLFIPINKNKIPELKNRMRQFQDEIIGWLQDEKEADQLVQLGTYLIPLKKR